jgi:hypothetical protein
MLHERIATHSVSYNSRHSVSNNWLTGKKKIESKDGLMQLGKQEGVAGLSKGMILALFGVSNGAIQFMAYEELKRWRVDARRNRLGPGTSEDDAKKLVRRLDFATIAHAEHWY